MENFFKEHYPALLISKRAGCSVGPAPLISKMTGKRWSQSFKLRPVLRRLSRRGQPERIGE